MTKPSNQQKARAGRHFVLAELHRRGAGAINVSRSGRRVEISASDAGETRTVTLHVKTKTTGDWQENARLGDAREEQPGESRFWVLVDIGTDPSSRVSYFVVPEWWYLNYIHTEIKNHLAQHGGSRPVNPDSAHCAIRPADVEHWRDRWDSLALW